MNYYHIDNEQSSLENYNMFRELMGAVNIPAVGLILSEQECLPLLKSFADKDFLRTKIYTFRDKAVFCMLTVKPITIQYDYDEFQVIETNDGDDIFVKVVGAEPHQWCEIALDIMRDRGMDSLWLDMSDIEDEKVRLYLNEAKTLRIKPQGVLSDTKPHSLIKVHRGISIRKKISLNEIALYTETINPLILYIHHTPILSDYVNFQQISVYPDLDDVDKCAHFAELFIDKAINIMVIDPIPPHVDLINFERMCQVLGCYGIGILE